VKVRTTVVGAVLAIVAAGALIISSAGSAKPEQDQFLAGVVSDVGRFNDRGFNQLSLKGCRSGARKAGGTCRALESRATSDYLPNFTRLERDGADIAIATGFLLAEGLATVARRFPDSRYTIVDYSVKAPPFANNRGRVLARNVVGLTFATNENSYMIGCLAAQMARRDGGNVISAVGGIKIPTVDIFIAAYRAGARRCVPGTRTLIDYSQDFVDQAKCKELALNQIQQGSKVVFQVAGNCGLGALDAANEQDVWGIGVDSDQSSLGSHILTSAVKRVDVAVDTVVRSAGNGSYRGGRDLVFNLRNNGVAIGKINRRVPRGFINRMNALRPLIINGRIKPPTKV
jgi:basic membrane protein A and related proteins